MTKKEVASIIEGEITINEPPRAKQIKIKVQSQTDKGAWEQFQKVSQYMSSEPPKEEPPK